MPTIQIRDVPEDVHRTYHRRAADAGMRLQEYLLDELTRRARQRTPQEVVREVREALRIEGPAGFSDGSSAQIIAQDRQRR